MCQRSAKRLKTVNDEVSALKLNEKETDQKIEKQSKDIEKMQELICNFVEKTRKDMDELKQISASKSAPSSNGNDGHLRESEERKKREPNVILYNMEENENVEKDVEKISQLLEPFQLKNKIKIQENEIPRVFRLGKPVPEKPRPMLITFTDKVSKISFLKKWKELKEINMWAQADMTLKQREKNRELIMECKRRNEAGENVKISRGKIVQRESQDIEA